MRHLHLHRVFQAFEECFEVGYYLLSIAESYKLFCDADVLEVILHQMLVNELIICKHDFAWYQLACQLPCH